MLNRSFLGTHQGTVELLRLRATASMAHYEVARHTPDGHAPNEAIKGHRDAIWGRVSDPATLFTWEALRPGHEVSGGAILESAWTTYPVLPGWCCVSTSMAMVIYKGGRTWIGSE